MTERVAPIEVQGPAPLTRRIATLLGDSRPRQLRSLASIAVALVTLADLAHLALGLVRQGPFVSSSIASAYWVNYSDGFVRRGLPGTVLYAITGGHLTDRSATLFAAVLLAVACSAFVGITIIWVRRLPRADDRLFAAVLVLASPFTFSLAVRDVGRYDAICYATLVAIAALATWGRRSKIRRPSGPSR